MSVAPFTSGDAPVQTPIKIGVIGLGRAFTLMLPTFMQDPRVQLVAACDPIDSARAQFAQDFAHAHVYTSAEALCQDAQVELVYIASPHQFHAQHCATAAAAGKHMMVEKPMALSLQDCTQMVGAASAANVRLIVGHSHSFNAPILRTKSIIDRGEFGKVRMITALNFTDFLYRPRRPEELVTGQGGGVIHSQAAHQVDIVRLLGGGLVRSVQAQCGAWDRQRPTEGAYSALLGFEGGAFATLTYSGYAHFDSDVWMDGAGEMGQPKTPADYGAARQRLSALSSPDGEGALKASRNYGGALSIPRMRAEPDENPVPAHNHFGPLIISCDHADLRPTAAGVWVHGHTSQSFIDIPGPQVPRQEVIDELWGALRLQQKPLHSGEWARASTEVCLGILQASQTGQSIVPQLQVAA